MTQIEEKFSLFNELDNIMEYQQHSGKGCYSFSDVGTLVLNDIYISIPARTLLHINLKDYCMSISTDTYTFEVDYDKINDFHILLK